MLNKPLNSEIQGTQYLIILPLFWPWFFLFQRPAQRPLNPANKSLIPQGSAHARMGIPELSIVMEWFAPLLNSASMSHNEVLFIKPTGGANHETV